VKTRKLPENIEQHPVAHIRALLRSARQQLLRESVTDLPLSDMEAVVCDLETTGFYPDLGDEIISIGAVQLDRGMHIVEDDTFYTLVNPNRSIPQAVSKLTMITDEMVSSAPNATESLCKFLRYVGDRPLIVHGASHDKMFLNATLWKITRTALPHRLFDTMQLCCRLNPRHVEYGLDDWLRFYNIANRGRHHALGDAYMTARLWSALLVDLQGIEVRTVGDLYDFLASAR